MSERWGGPSSFEPSPGLRRRGSYARAYYASGVQPPKQPGAFALEVWAVDRAALALDLRVFEERQDIGRVDVWDVE